MNTRRRAGRGRTTKTAIRWSAVTAAALMIAGLAWAAAQPDAPDPDTDAAPARTPAPATAPDAAPAPAPAGDDALRLHHLAFLTGVWTGHGLGGEIEEFFLPPKAGAMVGHFRLFRDGDVVFYEYILIEQTDAGVEMRLHHFNPGMTRWEDEPVLFELASVEHDPRAGDDGVIVADWRRTNAPDGSSPDDPPNRLRYTVADDRLVVELGVGGPRVTRFAFERSEPGALFKTDGR